MIDPVDSATVRIWKARKRLSYLSRSPQPGNPFYDTRLRSAQQDLERAINDRKLAREARRGIPT